MLARLIRAKVWICLLILGIGVIAFGIRGINENNRPAIDMSEPGFEWSELNVGDHVVFDTDQVFPAFAQVIEKDKVKGRYYAMPHIVNEDGMYSIDDFLGIYVRTDSKQTDSYDDLSEAAITWWTSDAQDIDGTPVHIDGIIKEMPSDYHGFFTDYISEFGFDNSFINDSHCKLAIYPTEKNGVLILGIGIICTVVSVVVLFFKLRKR
ncbi:MAG: hypothetical protein J5685_02940 [Clostridiales bacterium]|nr:hypothetical protein [Clostridiales bacterium]